MGDTMSYLYETKKYFEEKLSEYMPGKERLLEKLQESINYSLYSGGKRIRPLFAFIVGDLFGVARERMVSLACALEMIHTASLIMDDLPHMDNAALRRGKPANHVIYGQDVAALASIGLLMRAYEIVVADPGLPADKKALIVGKLAGAVGIDGLVGGQFVDLKYASQSVEYPVLEYIHNHKTASLFVASGTTAAIIGEASEQKVTAIEEYAENLGFAFQILDDLLDVTGAEEEVGKSLQKDKGSFVAFYGLEKCRGLVKEYTDRAIKSVKIFDGRNSKLVALGQMLLTRKS
jgi:geranylgeranyl diphosphate synthase, type II